MNTTTSSQVRTWQTAIAIALLLLGTWLSNQLSCSDDPDRFIESWCDARLALITWPMFVGAFLLLVAAWRPRS